MLNTNRHYDILQKVLKYTHYLIHSKVLLVIYEYEGNGGKNLGGKINVSYFYETIIGSRCSLWTPDEKMEP